MVLLDRGTPGTSAEIHSKDADNGILDSVGAVNFLRNHSRFSVFTLLCKGVSLQFCNEICMTLILIPEQL